MKYVRVMDGLKSNAGGFDYKLDEINISKIWDKSTLDPEKMGGFNFGTEDKILRWLHRGDTIYDVIIPADAEVILCDEEKGIYRSNKIIVTNPKTITDELVMDLYSKTTLSDKIIAQCLTTLLWKDRLEICKYIIKDRVNSENIDNIIFEFEEYAGNGDFSYDKLGEKSKIIYDILKKLQSSYVKRNIVNDILIRKATLDDIVMIQNLNNELFKLEKENYDSTLVNNWSLTEEGRLYFEDLILNHYVIVASFSDEVVGYLAGTINDKDSYEEVQYGEINNMLVNDNYRGIGIGNLLVDNFKKYCKENNINNLKVEASAKNLGAINFYKKNGFEDFNDILTMEI